MISILKHRDTRKDFILKLKNSGENSIECQYLRKIMTNYKMKNQPPGIHQSTILKHAFQFSDTLECFKSFRYVCQSWKFAVETSKFCKPDGWRILLNLANKSTSNNYNAAQYPKIYNKILSSLKNLRIILHGNLITNFDSLAKLITSNMKKLKKIKIHKILIGDPWENLKIEQYETFVSTLLLNSKNSLIELQLPKFSLPMDVYFPNLIKICFGITHVTLPEFRNQFSKMLINLPELKIISIDDFFLIDDNLLHFIVNNYAENCIYSDHTFGIPIPVKMQSADDLSELLPINHQFIDHIVYLNVFIDLTDIHNWGWDQYQTIFQNLHNLKGILFTLMVGQDLREIDFFSEDDESNLEIFETIENFTMWKERIIFIKNLGIKILDHDKYKSKEIELSKNLRWRFRFV